MGTCCGSDSISELEDMTFADHENGVIKRNRHCTDKYAIVGMGLIFAILIVLISICMANGDIDRILNGYDDCGNVCGKLNKNSNPMSNTCFGQDKTDKSFLFYNTVKLNGYHNTTTKTCVTDCKNEGAYVAYLNRCFPAPVSTSSKIVSRKGVGDFLQNVSEDIQMCLGQIFLLTFLSLVFSMMVMILLRYATAFVVWFVLIGLSVVLIAATGFLWFLYMNSTEKSEKESFLAFAIIITIFTVVILLVLLVMRKRVKLVIQLFKESAKAIACMPLLLFQPILTFIAVFITVVCGVYFSIWLASSGDLQQISTVSATQQNIDSNSLVYSMSKLAMITNAFNYVCILWMIQFIIGCQHVVVGGCVATWFFSRNKDNLGSPIITNTTNLVKYHLGTVAFGSLIITIIQIIKAIVHSLKTSMKNSKSIILYMIYCCIGYFLDWIEAILKYFSRNAYIQTAIYGYPFCYGGKKAFKLLMNNIFKVAAINSVGDFVLFFIKVFIVLFTVLIGFEMIRDKDALHYLWFQLVLIGIISYFIAHCFLTIFEMAVDTIFLCFCEDCEQNDGLSRPYYMSRNLMEFVEKTNKHMNKLWEATDQQAWDNGPKKIIQQGS